MKNKSMLTRILVPTMAVLAVGLAIQAWFLGSRATALSSDMSRKVLEETASRYAAEFEAANSRVLGGLEAFAPMMLQSGNSDDGRDEVIRMMRSFVQGNEYVSGMWTEWLPDAFDGRDSEHIGETYHNAAGIYMPYIFRSDSGIGMGSLEDRFSGDDTMAAAETGKQVTGEPFYAGGGMNKRLLYSVSIPVVKDGKVAGVLGADIDLGTLASAMAESDGLSTGSGLNGCEVFTISPGGLMATHPDNNMLMQPFRDSWAADLDGLDDALYHGGSAYAAGRSEQLGSSMAVSAVSLPLGGGQGSWVICASAPYTATIAPALVFWLGAAAAAILLFVAIYIVLGTSAGRQANELRGLISTSNAIANGKFMTVTLSAKKTDSENELDHLRRSLAVTANGMKRQLRAVRRMADGDMTVEIRPRGRGDSMNQALQRMAADGNEFFTRLDRVVQDIADQSATVNGRVAVVAKGLEDSMDAAGQLADLSGQLATAANRQADTVSQQQEAVNDRLAKGAEQMGNMIGAIEDLSMATQGVDDMAAAMGDLAELSKCIAMKASLEVAMAGGEHKERLAKLSVKVKDLFDLCNESKDKAAKLAGNRKESAELAKLIVGDAKLAMNTLEVVAGTNVKSGHAGTTSAAAAGSGAVPATGNTRQKEAAPEAKPANRGLSRMTENVNRILVAVHVTGQSVEESAEGLAAMSRRVGELEGMMKYVKVREEKPKPEGIRLELKKPKRGQTALLPPVDDYKSAAGAGR